MEFIKIILDNSTLKEAKLYNSAKKASANPEIGVTINHQAAFHVIKDCAAITVKYLPMLAFGSYDKPFESLKGKFKQVMIKEFVDSITSNVASEQLMAVIMHKADNMKLLTPSTGHAMKFDNNSTDPYGDYGCVVADAAPASHANDDSFQVLCKLFDVKD